MKLSKKLIAVPAIALAAGIGLAACGSAKTPVAAPTVTHTVTPAAVTAPAATPKPTTPAPTAPAPAKTVYVQEAPAGQPAAPVYSGANCSGGVYAGPNTSCTFALNVYQAWSHSGATNYITAYSPVTGESYSMYCGSNGGNDPIITCTGGDNASVQFAG